jgi:hypothetical protein
MAPMAPERVQLAAAFATVLAVLFTQQFLSIHELQHIGETDSSHCIYAPLAAAAGGAVLVAVPALPTPLVTAAAFPTFLVHAPDAPAPFAQARGPPSA